MTSKDFADAASVDEAKIPVIDVSGAINGDDLEGVARAIFSAATDHGFFYISNHGIDQSLIEQAFGVSKSFFDLPKSDKGTIAVNTDQRGWMATGMSTLQAAGLQVKTKSHGWIEAPPIEGTLVCNIGDLLARWSNGRFASTVHRVINRTNSARYSIPVFFDPHTDAVVDPIDLGVERKDSLYRARHRWSAYIWAKQEKLRPV
ncbi:putative iron/ascorbate oxidoreductase [Nymphon striatum]|nr:putative iron/ascorbate oxidoreductase [Nymphon striatum]